MNLRSGRVMRPANSPRRVTRQRASKRSIDDDVVIVDVKWVNDDARRRAAQRTRSRRTPASAARSVKAPAPPARFADNINYNLAHPHLHLQVHSNRDRAKAAIDQAQGESNKDNDADLPLRDEWRKVLRRSLAANQTSARSRTIYPSHKTRGARIDLEIRRPIKKRVNSRRVLGDISNHAPIAVPAAATSSTLSPLKRPECGICLMPHEAKELHTLGTCNHGYCTQCLSMHLKCEVQNSKYPITCPGCEVGKKKNLDTSKCDFLLRTSGDTATADALGLLDAKYVGLKNPKFCSNPQCAMVFDYEGDGDRRTARIDCPLCHTSTCVLCNSKWHSGRCERSKDELELLKNDNYNECPGCFNFVERIDGCNFIKCRCGVGFCFHCGTAYQSLVPTPENQHGTPGCKCAIYQGTQYETAVQTARSRHRQWLATVSTSQKAKSNWKDTSQAKFREIFREEYRKVYNANRANPAIN